MAVFKLDPERESVEELIEPLAVYLTQRCGDAEDELIREDAVRAARDFHLSARIPTDDGGTGMTVAERRARNRLLAEQAACRATAMRELQARAAQIVSDLRSEDLANRLIGIAASEGEAAAAAALRMTGVPPVPSTASQAVGMVALNLESRLENQRLTRYPQDSYKRIMAMYTPNTLLGVSTARVQQAQAVHRFLAEGIPGFVDKSDRRWTIGAYAEMAGMTTVNRAFNDAGIWRMAQSGIPLVTVVRGLDSCRKCAACAGKIRSTDGTPAGSSPLARYARGMAVRWLFGDAVTFEGGAELHPMTFDVDVLNDVARYMRRDGSGLAPRLVVRRWAPGLAMPTDTVVSLDKLEALSAPERRLLVLESPYDSTEGKPYMTIDFRSDATFRVDSQHVSPELVSLIVEHLQSAGRLRPAWPRIVPFVPPLFALVTAVLGWWAIASSEANLASVLFTAAIVLALTAVSIAAAFRLLRWAKLNPTGARFREGSRAGVRERLQNTKATVLISLVTVPAGAVIGGIVTAWLGS